jgi:GTP-binding protein HflX
VYETERSDGVASERAILVRVILPGQNVGEDPLDEISGLAETAGARVMSGMVQRREAPDVTTYLGKGKVNELKNVVEHHDADVVVFDNDLAPSQTRNLEKTVGVKVLDRTELILDIFAGNAKTYEAGLAVELAQLEYSLPRLKRLWSHLSRIKAGIGMRGPGEKQLEVDRRLALNRIHDLRNELRGIEKRKERLVASRGDRLAVSLVGYTNAGKSTLMNALTGAGVYAANKLFATLDTRTRRWMLPSWGPVLLSDTVGFIRDLPHGLIASFKATLEEARQADLLLHVADAANPAVLDQISAVYDVLHELEIDAKDTLLVLNKVDRLQEPSDLAKVLQRYPHAIPISARTREGFDRLHQGASEALSRSFADLDVETNVANGRMLAYLAAHGEVLDRQYDGQRVVVHVRLPQRHLGALYEEGTTFRPHSQAIPPASTGAVLGTDEDASTSIEEVA